MFEKVNPCHPDKVADRIAGALVDAAWPDLPLVWVATQGHDEAIFVIRREDLPGA